MSKGRRGRRGIKNPATWAGFLLGSKRLRLDDLDVSGLQALGALLDGELNLLALFQIAEPLALDRGEVNKHVLAAFLGQETVTLAAIEPLDRANDALRHFLLPPQRQH